MLSKPHGVRNSVWSSIFDLNKPAIPLDESQEEAIKEVDHHINDIEHADHQDVKEVLRELLETQLSTNEKTSVRIYYILRKANELDVIDDIVTGETFERMVALLKRTQKRWEDVSIYKTTIYSHWGTYDICNNRQHYSDNVLKALCALSKTGITSTDAKEALQNAIKNRRQLDKAPGVPRDPELQPMDVRAVLEERKAVGQRKKSGKKEATTTMGLSTSDRPSYAKPGIQSLMSRLEEVLRQTFQI